MAILTFILFNFFSSTQGFVPPGTVKLGHLYIDKTEVMNVHWLEYMYLDKIDSVELLSRMPDSSNTWYNTQYGRFMPITLITYEQALGYCQWRSEVVSKRLGFTVRYRLPTADEWVLIAQTVLYKNEKQVMKDLGQLKRKLEEMQGAYHLESRDYEIDKVYDLFSNVSEMTSTPGIAKGGNNYSLLERNQLLKDLAYTEISPYLGFRCIAEFER